MLNPQEIVIALIGTTFGGAGVKAIDGWFQSRKAQEDRQVSDSISIRKELREENVELRAENLKLIEKFNDCQTRFLGLLEEKTKQGIRLEELIHERDERNRRKI